MGQVVCQAVSAEPDMDLVAAIDPSYAGIDLGEVIGVEAGKLDVAGDNEALLTAGAEIIVDFTHVDAARANLKFCAQHGLHAVVGTSGFAWVTAGASACNGAVLMMRFAEMAAPFFDTAEIIELHHDAKVDAPSGTAVSTAERLAAASDDWAPDPTERETIPGARGAKGPAGIPVHSVRMRGMTAHQEVLLGTAGQTLSIRHDSFDRSSFMPGVILGVRRISSTPGLTIGLDGVLDL